MKDKELIFNAIQNTVFMTPAKAKKKLCLMCGPTPTRIDMYGDPVDQLEETFKTFCVANECMNWVQMNRIGFCVRTVDHITMGQVWTDILSK